MIFDLGFKEGLLKSLREPSEFLGSCICTLNVNACQVPWVQDGSETAFLTSPLLRSMLLVGGPHHGGLDHEILLVLAKVCWSLMFYIDCTLDSLEELRKN